MKIEINKKYTNKRDCEIVIHTVNGPDLEYPVVASVCDEGVWIPKMYTSIGRDNSLYPTVEDLIEVKEKKQLTGFVNVYEGLKISRIHPDKKNADDNSVETRIACINLSQYNILYEEGEGL